MCKISIPVFISAKGNDKEKLKLSITLLPYAFDYINQNEIINQTWFISDDDTLINLAKQLGFVNIYKEKCIHCKECHLDYMGPYHCILDNNINCEWFITVRLDQPFKGFSMIVDLITNIDDKYDLICTANYIHDRSMYFVDENDNFIYNTDKRLAEYCPKVKMIDAAAYAHKTRPFMECVKGGHFDVDIWKHKFKTVINKSIYVNIFDAKQMKLLNRAQETFIRVNNLENNIKN